MGLQISVDDTLHTEETDRRLLSKKRKRRPPVENGEEVVVSDDDNTLNISRYLSQSPHIQRVRVRTTSYGDMSEGYRNLSGLEASPRGRRSSPVEESSPSTPGWSLYQGQRRTKYAERSDQGHKLLKPRPGESHVNRRDAVPLPAIGSSIPASGIPHDAVVVKKKKSVLSGGPRPRNDFGGGTVVEPSRRNEISYLTMEPPRHGLIDKLERPSKKIRKQSPFAEIDMMDSMVAIPEPPTKSVFRTPTALQRKSLPSQLITNDTIHLEHDSSLSVRDDIRKHRAMRNGDDAHMSHDGLQSNSRQRQRHSSDQILVTPETLRQANDTKRRARNSFQVPVGSDNDSVDELAGPSEYETVKSARKRLLADRGESQSSNSQQPRVLADLNWVVRNGQLWQNKDLTISHTERDSLYLCTRDGKYKDPKRIRGNNFEEFQWHKEPTVGVLMPAGVASDDERIFLAFSEPKGIEKVADFLSRHAVCRVRELHRSVLAQKAMDATEDIEARSLPRATQGLRPIDPPSRTNLETGEERPQPARLVPAVLGRRNLAQSLQSKGEDRARYLPGSIDATLRQTKPSNIQVRVPSRTSEYFDRPARRPTERSKATEILQNEQLKKPQTRARPAVLRKEGTPLDEADMMMLASLVPDSRKFSKAVGLGDPWKHPLEYGPGRGRAEVHFHDLERLDEGEFLNDNVIEFYMRYLFNQKPHLAEKVYLFNTYFYTTLTKGQPWKKINYDAVRRWTRSVDLFAYDYIIVPVNEAFHWYLVIISNVSNLVSNSIESDGQAGDRMQVDAENENIFTDPIELDDVKPRQVEDGALQSLIEDLSSQPTTERENLDDGAHSRTLNGQEHHRSLTPVEQIDGITSDRLNGTRRIDDEEPYALRDAAAEQNAEMGTSDAVEDPQVALSDMLKKSAVEQDFEQSAVPMSTPASVDAVPDASHKHESESILNRPKKKARSYDPDAVAIIALDSLDAAHPQAARSLKSYIVSEAQDKKGLKIDPKDLQGITGKDIPRQDNFSDCGLYLLLYLAKFLDDPRAFVTKMLQRSFEPEDWDHPGPSQMREEIRDLLFDLHYQQERQRKRVKQLEKANLAAALVDSSEAAQQPSRKDVTNAQAAEGQQEGAPDKLATLAKSPQHPENREVRPKTRREALEVAVSIENDQEPDDEQAKVEGQCAKPERQDTLDTVVIARDVPKNYPDEAGILKDQETHGTERKPRIEDKKDQRRKSNAEAEKRSKSSRLSSGDVNVFVPRNEMSIGEALQNEIAVTADASNHNVLEGRSKYFESQSQAERGGGPDRPVTRGRDSMQTPKRTYSTKHGKRRSSKGHRLSDSHMEFGADAEDTEVIALD